MSTEMTKNEHIAAILAAGLLANPSRNDFSQGNAPGVATTIYGNILLQLANEELQAMKALEAKPKK